MYTECPKISKLVSSWDALCIHLVRRLFEYVKRYSCNIVIIIELVTTIQRKVAIIVNISRLTTPGPRAENTEINETLITQQRLDIWINN